MNNLRSFFWLYNLIFNLSWNIFITKIFMRVTYLCCRSWTVIKADFLTDFTNGNTQYNAQNMLAVLVASSNNNDSCKTFVCRSMYDLKDGSFATFTPRFRKLFSSFVPSFFLSFFLSSFFFSPAILPMSRFFFGFLCCFYFYNTLLIFIFPTSFFISVYYFRLIRLL